MQKKWQIVMAGAGGQGLLVTGMLLGEAAVVYENKYAVQTASYGIAARGGFTKAEVVISTEEIAYPKVIKPDVVVALTQEAYDAYRDLPLPVLIYDSTMIEGGVSRAKEYGYPLTRVAIQSGGRKALNFTALGALIGLTGLVSVEALEKAIGQHFGQTKAFENNWRAFTAGLELIRNKTVTGGPLG